MNNKVTRLVGVLLLAGLSGCSFNHPLARDYPQYLAKNGTTGSLPRTGLESAYLIDSKTQAHRYEFRSATVGYAHLWIVEFGKILDETLNAPYVQSSFGRLQKGGEGATNAGNVIRFTLTSDDFKDYRACVAMNVVFSSNGTEVLNKTYSSEGGAKGGQMCVAGPFGMKNATLDSTRSAIDKILAQFINDLPST